jgi:signal transduction histidine kinase/HAMP domain-containing protein/ActR/RegA family two-component response regulator
MKRFSSLRVRLAGIVLLAVAPALALLIYMGRAGWMWVDFTVGLFALGAAWIGGELFVLKQVKAIKSSARKLAAGDLSSRTDLKGNKTELGDLAQTLDGMAEALELQVLQREATEKALLNRALQQSAIAALGQCALQTLEMSTLFSQSVMLVAQTLEADFCVILELLPDGQGFRKRAGIGWNNDEKGWAEIDPGEGSQAGFTLFSGEPVVSEDVGDERRFGATQILIDHGIVSGTTVGIQGHAKPFGILGVHSAQKRIFTEDEGNFLLAVANLVGMAVERSRTEPEIQKLAAFAKFNPNPVLEFSSEGEITYFNDAAESMAASLGEKRFGAILPPDTERIVQQCLLTGEKRLQLETRPGSRILWWSFHPIVASNTVHCYVEDMTERTGLEDQLRQAQKMESVGQLAAGVAHDFNNFLTIIQGHSGLLMSRPNLSPAMTTSLQAMSFAAERAASLTRQLLMFSRKQEIKPKATDLNEVVANMSKMLQRLIGEIIKLECHCPPELPAIRGDTGMIEQVLMNLTVNARDAMPKGGRLLISTEVVQIDERYAQRHPNARPGDFVCLQVKDTGTGMDAATMKHIFEPFFTTKEEGKGTGLGLATVYGIVKQHAGWIEVGSQPGKGTAFRIFFPVDTRPAEDHTETITPATALRGKGETILVVEDEPVLRDLAQLILQDCGYRVVQAASGVEALTVWQKNQGAIDLLLTDVVMPDGLSGKDLAESLIGYKPTLKVVFTSGYNVDDLGTEFIQNNQSHFLQKPYSRYTVAKAVKDCLTD